MLEATLVHPWTTEVESVWKTAGEQLKGRTLIVDLSNVTFISTDGESTLFKLNEERRKVFL